MSAFRGMVKPVTYGRMGNFLFQAATALAYAWRYNLGVTMPSTTKDPQWNPIYLQHLVDPKFDEGRPSIEYKEPSFSYRPIPYFGGPTGKDDKNIILNGYWQSERYFHEFRSEIIQAFGFPWTLQKGCVSVHVRRGDYLTIKKGNQFKHPPVPKKWIETQMAKFPGAIFLFFSDDIEWCKQEFGERSDCFFDGLLSSTWTLKDQRQEVKDLVTMSCCEHHICSASTFSWWGAWLNSNPSKRVIMPKHWLSPGWGGIDTSDVVPSKWERA